MQHKQQGHCLPQEQPVTLPGRHSAQETALASDPVAAATPPDVSTPSPARRRLWWISRKQSGRPESTRRPVAVYSNDAFAAFVYCCFCTSRCKRSSCGRDRLPCGGPGSQRRLCPRSGCTSRGDRGGPPPASPGAEQQLWPIDVFLVPSGRSSRFLRRCQPAGRLPLGPAPAPIQGEKIPKRWLKTTMRQLCQHGRSSPQKHFHNNRRRGAKLTLKTTPPPPPH